ncbi:FAD-dependent oxidoreductase [Sphingosinicella microcystinivorans]|uniref:FAD-dependent oxidoreductase n=1 Tax=Sphingosinicella microcystinivorans TaxID=335406 RepID=UPI0022F38160|nr:FAD-dependent oxidoreductase [Sphingosinicella microcystinivorans]WBX82760.1 FAD-dependent oxidoreductase [Sphingosinicella microcystinivorans]
MSGRPKDIPGIDTRIARRDFVGGVLAASGMVGAAPVRAAPGAGIDGRWSGPGGVGDYAAANGNTAEVAAAAHRVRDGEFDDALRHIAGRDDVYDLVVVGGGVAGMAAAYALHTRRGAGGRCLVLENHRMFGGESRGNQIEVDGRIVSGPQGANQTGPYTTGLLGDIHRALGLPMDFAFADAAHGSRPLKIANDHFDWVFKRRKVASVGYYCGSGHGWIGDPWDDGLAALPWPADDKRNLLAWMQSPGGHSAPGIAGTTSDPRNLSEADDPGAEDTPLARWLDGMSYHAFVRDVMKCDPSAIARLVDPYLSNTLGAGIDCVSAYGARIMAMPGVSAADWRKSPDRDFLFSFPMGNAIYPRAMVRAMIPAAYADGGPRTLVFGKTRREALDRAENATRVRLGSTVVRVVHDGHPDTAETVSVIYLQDGRLYRVRAKGVVMACGGWIARRIVADMPEDYREAWQGLHYAPILVANVAVRHWRFLDRLGISAARWFDGFGYATNIRRPMMIDGQSEPLSPDAPTMLTFYVPFLKPGDPVAAQTVDARMRLFATPFHDFEMQIRRQMQEMFGAHGFDARRDIAGIVLNRWGHAFVVPEPGFFFGSPGRPPARAYARRGFGRIAFGAAELQGYQTWLAAYQEGTRAALQLI